MSTAKRKALSWMLGGLLLIVFPALIWSQSGTVCQSSFSLHCTSSGSSDLSARYMSSQVFIGRSTGEDTRVESGFYPITKPQTSTLAVNETGRLPTEYALRQNYPNPFNPSTTIHFDLPTTTEVRLVVYDLLGHEVVRLVDGMVTTGYHQVFWNGRASGGQEVSAGIYIARFITPESAKSIKMLLIK